MYSVPKCRLQKEKTRIIMEGDIVELNAFLRCRASEGFQIEGNFKEKCHLRVRKSAVPGAVVHPVVYFLSIGVSGKYLIYLDHKIESIISYKIDSSEMIRLNFQENRFFEIEFDGSIDEEINSRERWESVIKISVAAAIRDNYFMPSGKSAHCTRLREGLIENALARLKSLKLETNTDSNIDGAINSKLLISQGEYLLKCRRQMTELLMRLQNGGVDFISYSEVERLQRSIESKSDPFLSKDSDVNHITSMYKAMKMMKLGPRQTRASNGDEAVTILENIVQSLLTYPIYAEDWSSESDEDSSSELEEEEKSYCSTPSVNDSTKKFIVDSEEGEVDISTGNDVFVEASSVTVCVALPVKKEKHEKDKYKDDKMIPVSIESPKKKPRQIETPTNDEACEDQRLFECATVGCNPVRNSIFEAFRKSIWMAFFLIVLMMTIWTTPSQHSETAILTIDIHKPTASLSAMNMAEIKEQSRVISVISHMPLNRPLKARFVDALPFPENHKKVERRWFSKLWHRARKLRMSRKLSVDALMQQTINAF